MSRRGKRLNIDIVGRMADHNILVIDKDMREEVASELRVAIGDNFEARTIVGFCLDKLDALTLGL